MYLPHWETPRLNSFPGHMSRAETNIWYLFNIEPGHSLGKGGYIGLQSRRAPELQRAVLPAEVPLQSLCWRRHKLRAVQRDPRVPEWGGGEGWGDRGGPGGVLEQGWANSCLRACFLWLASEEWFLLFFWGHLKKGEEEYITGCLWPGKPEIFAICIVWPLQKKFGAPCFRGSVSKEPHGAHRGRRFQWKPLALPPTHSSDPRHRRPSSHCTWGQFHTLVSSCGARMGLFCARKSPGNPEWVGGEDRGSLWTHPGGARIGLASFLGTSLETWTQRHVPITLARPEGTCPLMVESMLCDFCALVYNLCKPPRNPNQSDEWKLCRCCMAPQVSVVKTSWRM